MDPRFILHPTHVVDRSSARFLPPGTSFAGGHSPALLPSHLSPVQPFYTAYDQTLGVGEVAFSASVPSGQAYFRTDRLPPGTTVLQEVPNPEVGGVGYGLGPVNLGYRNVALTSLNNLQVAEIGPSAGVHSLIVPSYADVSGCGHGYGNTALVCVYQAYPQAQIHAGPALLPLSPLPSRQHMFLDQALDQEYGSLDQINPPLRARRMEVVRIRKLERGRVLDQRRELQRKPDIQKAFLKKIREHALTKMLAHWFNGTCFDQCWHIGLMGLYCINNKFNFAVTSGCAPSLVMRRCTTCVSCILSLHVQKFGLAGIFLASSIKFLQLHVVTTTTFEVMVDVGGGRKPKSLDDPLIWCRIKLFY